MAICIIFKHKMYPSQNSFWEHNSTLTNPVTLPFVSLISTQRQTYSEYFDISNASGVVLHSYLFVCLVTVGVHSVMSNSSIHTSYMTNRQFPLRVSGIHYMSVPCEVWNHTRIDFKTISFNIFIVVAMLLLTFPINVFEVKIIFNTIIDTVVIRVLKK
jgi:hypothetical protein